MVSPDINTSPKTCCPTIPTTPAATKEAATVDEILNLLIGVKALNQTRYDRMWNTFECLIKHGIIKSD